MLARRVGHRPIITTKKCAIDPRLCFSIRGPIIKNTGI